MANDSERKHRLVAELVYNMYYVRPNEDLERGAIRQLARGWVKLDDPVKREAVVDAIDWVLAQNSYDFDAHTLGRPLPHNPAAIRRFLAIARAHIVAKACVS